jgi:hypothetical protein
MQVQPQQGAPPQQQMQQMQPMQQMGAAPTPMMQPVMMQPMQNAVVVPAGGDILTEVLRPHNNLFISQRIHILDGCCERQNVYSVYAWDGNPDSMKNTDWGSTQNPNLIMNVTENSDCCQRCWCDPFHSLLMHVEIQGNIYYTLERQGGCSKPGLICCPACVEGPCTDEMRMHRGNLQGSPGELGDANVMFTMRQAPAMESMFQPKINVFAQGSSEPRISLTGPTFFGGCSELCCDSNFPVESPDGKDKGHMAKLAPRGFCDCLKECATDSDNFGVWFNENTAPDEKAAILSSAFLTDYMLFERDTGKCRDTGSNIECTLCLMYCCGCLCPVKWVCPKNQGG